jgi:hypothetical protein
MGASQAGLHTSIRCGDALMKLNRFHFTHDAITKQWKKTV